MSKMSHWLCQAQYDHIMDSIQTLAADRLWALLLNNGCDGFLQYACDMRRRPGPGTSRSQLTIAAAAVGWVLLRLFPLVSEYTVPKDRP